MTFFGRLFDSCSFFKNDPKDSSDRFETEPFSMKKSVLVSRRDNIRHSLSRGNTDGAAFSKKRILYSPF